MAERIRDEPLVNAVANKKLQSITHERDCEAGKIQARVNMKERILNFELGACMMIERNRCLYAEDNFDSYDCAVAAIIDLQIEIEKLKLQVLRDKV